MNKQQIADHVQALRDAAHRVERSGKVPPMWNQNLTPREVADKYRAEADRIEAQEAQ